MAALAVRSLMIGTDHTPGTDPANAPDHQIEADTRRSHMTEINHMIGRSHMVMIEIDHEKRTEHVTMIGRGRMIENTTGRMKETDLMKRRGHVTTIGRGHMTVIGRGHMTMIERGHIHGRDHPMKQTGCIIIHHQRISQWVSNWLLMLNINSLVLVKTPNVTYIPVFPHF
jgi:hypothetical protein